MKFRSFSSFGIAILLFILVVLWINKMVHADVDCCPPPPLPAVAARFQQNAQVTVHLVREGSLAGKSPNQPLATNYDLTDPART